MDDLSAPDGPDSTTHSPALTWNDTPRTTGSFTPPCKCMVKVFSAFSIAIITVIGALLWGKDRGNQQLGVGLARIVQHLVGEAGLDHAAVFHHHHPVGQQSRDREVMRDDDGGQPKLVDE